MPSIEDYIVEASLEELLGSRHYSICVCLYSGKHCSIITGRSISPVNATSLVLTRSVEEMRSVLEPAKALYGPS